MTKKDKSIPKTLTPSAKEKRQKLAIPILAEATSVRKGCKAAGVSRPVYYQWCKDPGFVKDLEDAQKQVVKEQSKRMKALSRVGLDFIEGLLNDDYVKEIVDEYGNKTDSANTKYLALKLKATNSILDRIGALARVSKISDLHNPEAELDPFEGLDDSMEGVEDEPAEAIPEV